MVDRYIRKETKSSQFVNVTFSLNLYIILINLTDTVADTTNFGFSTGFTLEDA